MARHCESKTDGVGSVLKRSKSRWPVFLASTVEVVFIALLKCSETIFGRNYEGCEEQQNFFSITRQFGDCRLDELNGVRMCGVTIPKSPNAHTKCYVYVSSEYPYSLFFQL